MTARVAVDDCGIVRYVDVRVFYAAAEVLGDCCHSYVSFYSRVQDSLCGKYAALAFDIALGE